MGHYAGCKPGRVTDGGDATGLTFPHALDLGELFLAKLDLAQSDLATREEELIQRSLAK